MLEAVRLLGHLIAPEAVLLLDKPFFSSSTLLNDPETPEISIHATSGFTMAKNWSTSARNCVTGLGLDDIWDLLLH